jgi:hypothetical protein
VATTCTWSSAWRTATQGNDCSIGKVVAIGTVHGDVSF